MTHELGFEVRLNEPYDEAVEKVVAALKVEGFGVLTRIDVRAVLQEKLGQEFRPYVILGACNPSLSHRALSSDPEVGLVLPCNVTVEADPQGGSLVRIVNPEVMMEVGALGENPEVSDVARVAREKLERVAGALQEA
ncbi:MAG TPA: DUF302 domain-containing protein [Anaerolineales bacterium]